MRIIFFAPAYSSYEQVIDADTVAKAAEAGSPGVHIRLNR